MPKTDSGTTSDKMTAKKSRRQAPMCPAGSDPAITVAETPARANSLPPQHQRLAVILRNMPSGLRHIFSLCHNPLTKSDK